jgi:hypothetical protein
VTHHGIERQISGESEGLSACHPYPQACEGPRANAHGNAGDVARGYASLLKSIRQQHPEQLSVSAGVIALEARKYLTVR